jgi:non-ribosomal peptide synthetase-like protein
LFNGTPFKNLVARLLGVKLGKKVFNDGSLFFDKTLLEIGDYATLNEFAMFKGHSLEEGVFKSDRVVVGNGCTVGVGALIHYGVRIADDVVIGPDSFLMKGETPETGTVWRGNPARAISSAPATAPVSDASMDIVLAAGSAHRERHLQPVDLSSAG